MSEQDLQNLLMRLVGRELFGLRMEDFPCPLSSDEDWRTFRLMATSQRVAAIAWDSLQSLGWVDAMDGDEKVFWGVVVQDVETHHALVTKVAAALTGFVKSSGYKFRLLKGLVLASIYPVPQHRQFSDIDIYLPDRPEEVEALVATKFSATIEHGFNHHDKTQIGGVSVELHRYFFNQAKYASNRILQQRLDDLYSDEKTKKTADLLFLLRHAGSHFVSAELWLLNMTDVGRHIMAYGSQIDFAKAREVATECGFDRWYDVIISFLTSYMGFVPGFDVCARDVDALLMERVRDSIFRPAYTADEREGQSKLVLTGWFVSNRWKNKIVFARDSFALVYLRTILFWVKRNSNK